MTQTLNFALDLAGIRTLVEMGELVKLAALFGLDVEMAPEDEYKEPLGKKVLTIRTPLGGVDLDQGLVDLMIALAMVRGYSGDQVLEKLKKAMDRVEMPMDKPLADVMQIGGGPDHPGHRG